jgi:crotonobetainyl-CoA:carnitine CoA-transferase CaiB-like acyl-CoA transferase
MEVALSEAADFLALPQRWGLMGPSQALGGGHAGYGIYRCRDGRVALAALEPHFAAALADAAGLKSPGAQDMFSREAAVAIGAFVAQKTRAQLQALSKTRDIPLHTLD